MFNIQSKTNIFVPMATEIIPLCRLSQCFILKFLPTSFKKPSLPKMQSEYAHTATGVLGDKRQTMLRNELHLKVRKILLIDLFVK